MNLRFFPASSLYSLTPFRCTHWPQFCACTSRDNMIHIKNGVIIYHHIYSGCKVQRMGLTPDIPVAGNNVCLWHEAVHSPPLGPRPLTPPSPCTHPPCFPQNPGGGKKGCELQSIVFSRASGDNNQSRHRHKITHTSCVSSDMRGGFALFGPVDSHPKPCDLSVSLRNQNFI